MPSDVLFIVGRGVGTARYFPSETLLRVVDHPIDCPYSHRKGGRKKKGRSDPLITVPFKTYPTTPSWSPADPLRTYEDGI